YYRKALVLDEELGLKEGIATVFSILGILRQMRGDLAGAEEYYHKSLAIDDELGRKEGMAADYCNLGILRKDQGDLAGAEECWQKSVGLYQELGAPHMVEKVQGLLDEHRAARKEDDE
ncbi:MAG: tetratricopeptide repeat protein, partial [Desulfovibrionaceae bacterium]